LVAIKVLSTLMSVDMFAAYVLIITFQAFATFSLTGPLRVGLTRYHASALVSLDDADYRRFALSAFAASALITTFGAVVVARVFDFGSAVTVQGVVFAVLYGVLSDFASFLSSAALQMARGWLAVWLMMVGKLALLAGAVLAFIIFDELEPETILLFAILIFWATLFILRGFSVGSSSLRSLFVGLNWAARAPPVVRFGWIFVATGLISWAQMSMPRYFLSWWQTPEDVVRFFLVTQIALLSMMTITSVVGQTISPMLFRRHDDMCLHLPSPWQYELLGGAGLAFLVALGAVFFSLFAGDWVVTLLSKKDYHDISLLLAISFATYGFYAVAQVLRIYGDQIKRPQIYLSANVVYPAAAVGFSFLAVKHGLIFLCLALLTSEVLHLAMIAAINHKQYTSREPAHE
jgi:O-antigen/teichoic acid export membrane protein